MSTVMIVEDDDDIAVILEKRMQRRGFYTVRAHDARQAAIIYRKTEGIVLILSDFDMGGGLLNGDALWRELKLDLIRDQVPFVIISAVLPSILVESFAHDDVKVIEKWKLDREFDLTVAPLLRRLPVLPVQPAASPSSQDPVPLRHFTAGDCCVVGCSRPAAWRMSRADLSSYFVCGHHLDAADPLKR